MDTADTPLREAAERVLVAHEAESPTRDLRHELEELVQALSAALAGRQPRRGGPSESERLRWLRALRTELLADWPEQRPLLPVMQAFETVQRHLVESAETATVDEVLTPTARSVLREVAHMLRSPFGSIVMLVDTLREQERSLSPERREKLLAIIYRAALGVATTAGDLLTLVDDDTVGPEAAFSLPETLESVADLVRPVTEVRDCELSVVVEDPPGLFGPGSGVARVMLGLALRAALRTRDGSLELRGESEGPDRLRLSVAARGPGAAPEGDARDLLGIFRVEPDGASFTLSAEGMGLAATERLIRGMGSELRIEGGPEELSFSFSLELPSKH